MFKRIASIVLLVSLTSQSDAAIMVGPIVNPANGNTYYKLTAATWNDSEAEAVTLGGHLVTINDAAENAWVFSTFGGASDNLWIGLNDVASEGNFVWASGQPVTYTNWSLGQPDNSGGEDFVHFWNLNLTRWNDASVADGNLVPLFGIVEVEAVPEPTTLALWSLGALSCVVAGYRRRKLVGKET